MQISSEDHFSPLSDVDYDLESQLENDLRLAKKIQQAQLMWKRLPSLQVDLPFPIVKQRMRLQEQQKNHQPQ